MDKTRQFLEKLTAAGGGSHPDAELLARFARERDPLAFEALLRRHGPLVLGVCRRVLAHAQDAEDAFQATFLLLVRNPGRVRKGESLGSWLHGVAYRVALKARSRRWRRQANGPLPEPANAAGPVDDLVRQDLCRVLDEELDRLPAKYRRPLVLCYLEGKTSDVAARELGWKVGTLWGRLARGRKLLRGRLARCNLALSTAGLFALGTGSAAGGALPVSLTRATMAAAISPGSASVAELVQRVTLQMTLAKLRTVVGVMLAAGLLVFAGGHLLPWGEAVPAPEANKQPGAKDEIPPYDGKLRTDGQTVMPQGGKVVLYSRNRHGSYPLASYAFHWPSR